MFSNLGTFKGRMNNIVIAHVRQIKHKLLRVFKNPLTLKKKTNLKKNHTYQTSCNAEILNITVRSKKLG